MKNKSRKSAIALISLVVVIIVLLMLAGLITYSGYDIINQSKETAFANDIVKIEEAIQEYYLVNGSIPVLEDGITITTNQYKENISGLKGDKYSSVLSAEIIKNNDNEATFYEIDMGKIGIEDANTGIKAYETDYYIVSNASLKVYYYPGYKIGDSIYFSSIGLIDKN